MAVNYVMVKGYIRDGKLKVELPDDVPDGEVEVVLRVMNESPVADKLDEAPLTGALVQALYDKV